MAVGSRSFIEEIKAHLGMKAIGRKVREQGEALYALRESSAAYNADFATKKGSFRHKNAYRWNIS